MTKKRLTPAAKATAGRLAKKPAGKGLDTPEAKALLERLSRLEAEAAALVRQAESTHDVAAFRRAVDLLEQVVKQMPVDSARHGMAVINLCGALGSLYQRTGEVAALERGGQVVKHWLNSIPAEDWRTPLYILGGAVLAYRKAITTQAQPDEDRAIQLLESARALVRPGAGVSCTASTLLADLLLARYKQTRNLKDLAAGLDDAIAVVQAPRAMQWERRESAKTFVNAMVLRYEALRSVSDLDGAIEVSEMALADDLSPRDKAEHYVSMATALRYRFDEIRNPEDLERAIDCYKRVTQATVDDEERACSLDNYGNGLADRYRLTHNLVDLDEAIASSRAGLDLLPDKSPYETLILANLGVSLFQRYAATGDRTDLDDVVALQRRGLEINAGNPILLERLHAMLAQALLYQAVTSPTPGDLIRDALDHFARARALNYARGRQEIIAGLLARETSLWAADMEVGALMWLAEIDAANAPDLLRRALQVGEGAKSWALATDMARRPLPRPADVPEQLFEQERYALGVLAALDNSEIAGIPWAHQVHNTARRDDAKGELNSIWAEIAKASAAGARYVHMRRAPDQTWLDSVRQLEQGTAVLALLPMRDVRIGHRLDAGGIAALGMLAGMPAPFVIAADAMADPVPQAARQFEAEVPGDGGLGMRRETWHRPLAGLLGSQTPVPLKPARTFVVSPPRDGHNLPWNLVLQRAGWCSEEGNSLPVVTVPTLAILAPRPAQGKAEAGEPNELPPQRMMYAEPTSVDEALKLVLRMAEGWSGPLVVGNPTADLPAAEAEARAVAAALGSKPLIGPEAAAETILKALYDAPIIHLAAHAWFDEKDPLDSGILVADGTISARDLFGSYCKAELVVLSSCEGGVASRVIGGEVTGLGHALLRAGSRAVVASLWPVDDDATAFLMAAFYRARQPGVGEATALAQAMGATSAQPPWRHPYFWSGFVLMQREL